MIEFAILLFIDRRISASAEGTFLKVRLPTSKRVPIGSREFCVDKDMENEKMPTLHKTFYSRVEKIDFVALIVFMVSYSIFNAIYFAQYFYF